MENKTHTLGQKRVKVEFNPSSNLIVDVIKNKSAEIIDLLEVLKNGYIVSVIDEIKTKYYELIDIIYSLKTETTSYEKLRLIEHTQTSELLYILDTIKNENISNQKLILINDAQLNIEIICMLAVKANFTD